MIGVSTTTEGAGRWYRGGWASMQLFQSPSSASQFASVVEVTSRALRLGTLNLVVFPGLAPGGYNLQVKVPRYFQDAIIEVWRYDGDDMSVFDRLAQLETKIDSFR